MWLERGDPVFTDIFVRSLRERRTSLQLLPFNQSPRLSSFVRGRWMGAPRSSLFCFFFTLFIMAKIVLRKLKIGKIGNPIGRNVSVEFVLSCGSQPFKGKIERI